MIIQKGHNGLYALISRCCADVVHAVDVHVYVLVHFSILI